MKLRAEEAHKKSDKDDTRTRTVRHKQRTEDVNRADWGNHVDSHARSVINATKSDHNMI